MQQLLSSYINRHALSNIQLLQKNEHRCLLSAISPQFGAVILKVNLNTNEIQQEYNTLKTYNGHKFCNVYHFEKNLLLEQQIVPGTSLRQLNDLPTRLAIFCDLYQHLHLPPSHSSSFPSYLDWVKKISKFMQNQPDYPTLTQHMLHAEAICQHLFDTYPQRLLLHGDLHHDNILLNQQKTYTIIDPKGVIGPAFLDIPCFILNELDNEISESLVKKITLIITNLSEKLNLEKNLLKQCLYIETCLANCWNVEDQIEPNLSQVTFAYNLLNS